MFRKRKAQQEMEEISRMLERVLNGECIQPGEIGYERYTSGKDPLSDSQDF